jgi:xylulokinase
MKSSLAATGADHGNAGSGTDELVVGVDLGTSGTKAGIFDLDGTQLAEAYVESTLTYPRPGWVEQRQEDIYCDAIKAIRQCLRSSGAEPSRVAAIAFDSQMAGIGSVDASWKPVRNYDSWLDLRCTRYVEAIDRDHGALVTEIDGCPPMANHAPRIIRMMREEPAAFERVASFVVPSTYVGGRMAGLSGKEAYVDYTFIHFSGVADAKRGIWSEGLCRALGIPSDKLPRIVAPWTVIGELTARAAEECGLPKGTPIAAGAGDQAAGALGAGIVDAGMVFDSAGTAAVLAACVDRFMPDVANRTLVISRSVLPDLWMPLSYVAGGGLCLRWFRDAFGAVERAQEVAGRPSAYAVLDSEAADIRPGSDRLWFVPHLGGRTLPSLPAVRGTWLGFTWSHTRAHFFRAILESVAYEYQTYLEIQRQLLPTVQFTEACVIGGGARSNVWNQIKADVLGIPYIRLDRSEVACWGAAMIAGHSVGLIGDLAVTAREHARRGKTVAPIPQNHAFYQQMSARYALLLHSLEPMFAVAQSITD